nr:hypothetical protein OG546_35780 [Streptomyces antimycoticus]
MPPPYTRALRISRAAMATGIATLTLAACVAILAGALLIRCGEITLFLKDDLVALARPRSPDRDLRSPATRGHVAGTSATTPRRWPDVRRPR